MTGPQDFLAEGCSQTANAYLHTGMTVGGFCGLLLELHTYVISHYLSQVYVSSVTNLVLCTLKDKCTQLAHLHAKPKVKNC